MSTETTIPADWDVTDPDTWTLSATVDAHMGCHHTGAVLREYRTITLRARDLGDDIEPTAEHAEWWADVLGAKLAADEAILQATPEQIAAITDLLDERTDADDFETEAAVCRRIVAALA